MNHNFDAIVIGAGFIGCSVAYSLSQTGLKIAIIDQGVNAAAASGANFGNIQIQDMELEHSAPLTIEGFRCYRTIREELDWPLSFRRIGSLLLIENETQHDIMQKRMNRLKTLGIQAELLTNRQVKKVEPLISTNHLSGGLYHPDEAQIDPFELMGVMLYRARQNGLQQFFKTTVTALKYKTGQRIRISTPTETFSCDHVVICTGAFTNQIGHLLGRDWGVHYVLGQAYVTEYVPFRLNNHLTSASFFENCSFLGKGHLLANPAISQNIHGQMMAGESMFEASHFQKNLPVGALPAISQCWLKYFPQLGNLRILRSWSAPVADMPDGLPLLGPVPDMPGVYLATAFRSTVVVTPLIGKIMSNLITNTSPALDLSPFLPERKSDGPN